MNLQRHKACTQSALQIAMESGCSGLGRKQVGQGMPVVAQSGQGQLGMPGWAPFKQM
jgi:hypothetical protein